MSWDLHYNESLNSPTVLKALHDKIPPRPPLLGNVFFKDIPLILQIWELQPGMAKNQNSWVTEQVPSLCFAHLMHFMKFSCCTMVWFVGLWGSWFARGLFWWTFNLFASLEELYQPSNSILFFHSSLINFSLRISSLKVLFRKVVKGW